MTGMGDRSSSPSIPNNTFLTSLKTPAYAYHGQRSELGWAWMEDDGWTGQLLGPVDYWFKNRAGYVNISEGFLSIQKKKKIEISLSTKPPVAHSAVGCWLC